MNSRREWWGTSGEKTALSSPLGGSKHGQNRGAFPTTPGGLRGGRRILGQLHGDRAAGLACAKLPFCRASTAGARGVSLVSVPGALVTVASGLLRLSRLFVCCPVETFPRGARRQRVVTVVRRDKVRQAGTVERRNGSLLRSFALFVLAGRVFALFVFCRSRAGLNASGRRGRVSVACQCGVSGRASSSPKSGVLFLWFGSVCAQAATCCEGIRHEPYRLPPCSSPRHLFRLPLS